MKLLIDINVVLDVVLEREPWARDAALLLATVDMRRAEGYVAGHTVTTVHYLVARARGRQAAASAVSDLLRIVEVVPLGGADFQQALAMGLDDFEDAVQVAAGLRAGADYVVTRNEKDFRGTPLAARSPGEVLALL